jgi:signal transduction histidine kinase/putative methionine-R-sulfoxide reductase with GAF domain
MVDISRERTAPASAPGAVEEREPRSVAQLKMLHSLAAQLNRLTDVKQIGDAITVELKTIIDYHNCRVYLLAEDDDALEPTAFRGELTEYEGETYEELVTKVGEGITGHVAETKRSFYTPNAEEVEFAVQIAGTGEVLESILAVPMLFGDRVTGVIVLSNLGYDQFDQDDMRLLEVLAAHAGVAFENARLFQREREAAETASAMLGLSQAMTGLHDLDAVVRRTVAAVPPLIPCFVVGAFVREPDGRFVLGHSAGAGVDRLANSREIDALTASEFLASLERPFVLTRAMLDGLPEPYRPLADVREALVAPLRWEPDGFGAVLIARTADQPPFTDRDVRLARGMADITSLALGAARRVHELERFHELVESLEATFWEADPGTLTFSFLSSRAATMLGRPLLGPDDRPEHWGDHVIGEDRGAALTAVRATMDEGDDRSIEYRARGPGGEVLWLRDVVHVVRDAHGGIAALRGLMVDITERKRAEQALRRSERKYSEAFRREREAAQRLRALDDMKNTFLEAVSHDLRTPLTSILGSALTLEQTGTSISTEDGLDLVQRIAANARKLERLLSDLLDLDRLQRGIVSPQRRLTDLGTLVRQTVEDSDLLRGHPVELDTPTVEISIDAAKVERIVENLLANAARHTRPGTRIWLRVAAVEEGALLTVEDEGTGVPPELRQAIFEPFRQGDGPKSHSPGVGVGLSLVARFAELHGGRAWVEDREGGGASFKVLLPG